MATTCVHVKDDGSRCGQWQSLSPVNGKCIWHDPERSKEAATARRRGGIGASKFSRAVKARAAQVVHPADAPPPPATLQDCATWASWLAHAVVTGRLDARTCKEGVTAINSLRGSVEKLDLSARTARLEAELAELKRRNLRAS
jgi:hypothetical protein